MLAEVMPFTGFVHSPLEVDAVLLIEPVSILSKGWKRV